MIVEFTGPRFLDWLNQYANLLLVLITAAYAFLTYLTLQTLNRSNLREREARHLDDIKAFVAEPLLRSVAEVTEKLQGRQSTVILLQPSDSGLTPRGRYQISPAPFIFGGLNHILYIHSKEHFPQQLGTFDPFHNAVERLFGDIATFAKECCDYFWQNTDLLPFSATEPLGWYVNFESLMFASLHYLLCGDQPEVFINPGIESGVAVVNSRYNGPGIAQDLESNVRNQFPKMIDEIETRWKLSGLKERVRLTLEDAERVQKDIEDIQISYALNRACRYVGK